MALPSIALEVDTPRHHPAGIGAAAILIVLPVSAFAFFVRKTIVQGLTMGALNE